AAVRGARDGEPRAGRGGRAAALPSRADRLPLVARIAVLGAGVAGLTAARRLALGGHAVDVYERWPGLGGQAATLDVGGGHRPPRHLHPPLPPPPPHPPPP